MEDAYVRAHAGIAHAGRARRGRAQACKTGSCASPMCRRRARVRANASVGELRGRHFSRVRGACAPCRLGRFVARRARGVPVTASQRGAVVMCPLVGGGVGGVCAAGGILLCVWFADESCLRGALCGVCCCVALALVGVCAPMWCRTRGRFCRARRERMGVAGRLPHVLVQGGARRLPVRSPCCARQCRLRWLCRVASARVRSVPVNQFKFHACCRSCADVRMRRGRDYPFFQYAVCLAVVRGILSVPACHVRAAGTVRDRSRQLDA